MRIKSTIDSVSNPAKESWYKFLDDLYIKFSEYEIQKDRSRYNVVNLEDWGTQRKPQVIEINKNNFERFLQKIAKHNIADYNNIKNITIIDSQLRELNHVLNLTLKNEIVSFCPKEDELVVKGDYVKFSDFVKTNGKLDNLCKNNATLKVVNIFALNSIFIDKDLDGIGDKLRVSIIAPKWEFIGIRKITLDGTKGENGRGVGEPGFPGNPGGALFGIGMWFVNGVNGTITSNGGAGGSGQDGKDGNDGQNGQHSMIDSTINCINLCDNNNKMPGLLGTHDFSINRDKGKCHYEEFNLGNHYFTQCRYHVFGIPGEKGGNGTDGGRGGKGGNSGNIMLFELTTNSGISKYNNAGIDGDDGIGGKGGTGGINGDDVIVSCQTSIDHRGRFGEWRLHDIIYNERRNKNGTNGIDGVNIKGIKEPEVSAVLKERDKIKIINEYKSYLREHLNDRFKKSSLTQFYKQLDSNPSVKNVYNTLGLFNDLQGLEEQSHKLNKEVDFIPFYQSLLNRISEYAQKESEDQYKRTLSYLYTSTLGRIHNLENNLGTHLIIDIDGYLSSLKESMEGLQGLKEERNRFHIIVNKLNTIKKYKENYNDNLQKEIQEANSLIEKQVIPEIDNISIEIDNKIGLLISELMTLKAQNQAEQEKLVKKKQELENILPLKGLFSALSTVCQVLSFFGPIGSAAASVVGTVNSVAEHLVLDKQHNQQRVIQLPQSITLMDDQIKAIRDKEVARINMLLEAISQEANKYPVQLSDISEKITDIKTRLNKANNFNEVKVLRNAIPQALKRKEAELKIQKVTLDQETANAIAVIGKFKQVVECGAGVVDIYIHHKKEHAKLDAITNAIEEKKNEFHQLKQYEERIYDVIIPTLQNMRNALMDIANTSGNKSSVTLDIIEWQVQGVVRDTKLQMQELTQGFKVKDNLARCIEKLEEAMTVMLNVYDRIQDYQKEQNLANYIADISATIVNDNNIENSELKDAISYLDITISSNLILHQYQIAIDVFKQFVFPFAHTYFKGLMLPSHLELGGTRNNTALENLVSEAARQIDHIKSQLDAYKKVIGKHDKAIIKGEFEFVVWKYEQHKNMILKLLSGEEVVVKADIRDSLPNQDAIKFNAIKLNFMAKNSTIQSEINDLLKHFAVTATHLGNSYYRYDDKIYLITTSSQEIYFTFANKAGQKEPKLLNDVYDKLQHGNSMLSPYALWKIKLSLATRETSFKDLEKYKDEVHLDLELGGYGHGINNEKINEDLMVEKYYKAIDAYDQLDFNVKVEEVDTL